MSIYEEYFTLFQGDLVIIYKDNIPKVMNSVNKLFHICCNYMNRQHKWHFIATCCIIGPHCQATRIDLLSHVDLMTHVDILTGQVDLPFG